MTVTYVILDRSLAVVLLYGGLYLGGHGVRPALVVIVKDGREGWTGRGGRRFGRCRLRHHCTAKVARLKPFLEHFDGQMDEFPFALFPSFDQLQKGDGTHQISAQL